MIAGTCSARTDHRRRAEHDQQLDQHVTGVIGDDPRRTGEQGLSGPSNASTIKATKTELRAQRLDPGPGQRSLETARKFQLHRATSTSPVVASSRAMPALLVMPIAPSSSHSALLALAWRLGPDERPVDLVHRGCCADRSRPPACRMISHNATRPSRARSPRCRRDTSRFLELAASVAPRVHASRASSSRERAVDRHCSR